MGIEPVSCTRAACSALNSRATSPGPQIPLHQIQKGGRELIGTSLQRGTPALHSIRPNSLCYPQARTCCTGATPRAGGSGEEPGKVARWQPDPLHLSLPGVPLAPPPERPPREGSAAARAPRRGSSSGACALPRPPAGALPPPPPPHGPPRQSYAKYVRSWRGPAAVMESRRLRPRGTRSQPRAQGEPRC